MKDTMRRLLAVMLSLMLLLCSLPFAAIADTIDDGTVETPRKKDSVTETATESKKEESNALAPISEPSGAVMLGEIAPIAEPEPQLSEFKLLYFVSKPYMGENQEISHSDVEEKLAENGGGKCDFSSMTIYVYNADGSYAREESGSENVAQQEIGIYIYEIPVSDNSNKVEKIHLKLEITPRPIYVVTPSIWTYYNENNIDNSDNSGKQKTGLYGYQQKYLHGSYTFTWPEIYVDENLAITEDDTGKLLTFSHTFLPVTVDTNGAAGRTGIHKDDGKGSPHEVLPDEKAAYLFACSDTLLEGHSIAVTSPSDDWSGVLPTEISEGSNDQKENDINIDKITFTITDGDKKDVSSYYKIIVADKGTLKMAPVGRVRYNATSGGSLGKLVPQYPPLFQSGSLGTEGNDVLTNENTVCRSESHIYAVNEPFIVASGEPTGLHPDLEKLAAENGTKYENLTFLGWFDKFRTTGGEVYMPAIREAGNKLTYLYSSDDLYTLDALWAYIEVKDVVKVYDAESFQLAESADIQYQSGESNLAPKYVAQINGSFTDSNVSYETQKLVEESTRGLWFRPEKTEDGEDVAVPTWSAINPSYTNVGEYPVSVQNEYILYNLPETEVHVEDKTYTYNELPQIVQTLNPATVTILKRPLIIQFGSNMGIPFDGNYYKGKLTAGSRYEENGADGDYAALTKSEKEYTGTYFNYASDTFGTEDYSSLYTNASAFGLVSGHTIEVTPIYTSEDGTTSKDGGREIGTYKVDIEDPANPSQYITVRDAKGKDVTANYEIKTIEGKVEIVPPTGMGELKIEKALVDDDFEGTVTFDFQVTTDDSKIIWFKDNVAVDANTEGAQPKVSITLNSENKDTTKNPAETTGSVTVYLKPGYYYVKEIDPNGNVVDHGGVYSTTDGSYEVAYNDRYGSGTNITNGRLEVGNTPTAYITITNTARYYYIAHYVADLTDGGMPETTDTFDNSYYGYVPLKVDRKPLIEKKRLTANLTAAKVHSEVKDAYPADGWSISDQHIASPSASEEIQTGGESDYEEFVYASGEAVKQSDTKYSTWVSDANANYLKGKSGTSITADETVPVFWDRVLEFTEEDDGRYVEAHKFLSQLGAQNNIRQSKITYETEYWLWNKLGNQGSELLQGEDNAGFVIKDAWQQTNAIDMYYENTDAAKPDNDKTKKSYVFHSVVAETVDGVDDGAAAVADDDADESTDGEGIKVYSDYVRVNNTKGNTDTHLNLVPLILVQYNMRYFDASGKQVESKSYNVKSFFTIDFDVEGGVKNPSIGTMYLTSLTLDKTGNGYSDWKIGGWDGDVAKDLKSLSIYDLIEAGYLDTTSSKMSTDSISGRKFPTINLYSEKREPLATPSPAPAPTPTPAPGTVSISGRKTWVDVGDAAGIRPSSITVVVLQNGREYQSQVVTADNGWLYTFVNLPATDPAGNPYRYTIGEHTVSGYVGRTEGFNLVNELMDGPDTFDPTSQSGFVGTGLTEEQLESGAMLFDYGAELWSDLLETGDELPIYPFIFGGIGVAAVVVLLVLSRKKKKEQ